MKNRSVTAAAAAAVAATLSAARAEGFGAASSYSEVADTAWRYQSAKEEGDAAALAALLDSIWTGRRAIASGGGIIAESKEEAIARLSKESERDGAWRLTSIQVFHDDFAVARLDDFEAAEAQILLLFKVDGAWRVAGEALARAETGRREPVISSATAEARVLQVLQIYYQAVAKGGANLLAGVFDDNWRMKNHKRTGGVATEDKPTFMTRIDGRPYATYVNDRQVADVQVIYDHLAYVRIDKPSTTTSTVFLFYRQGDRWIIVDKAWSDGVGE